MRIDELTAELVSVTAMAVARAGEKAPVLCSLTMKSSVLEDAARIVSMVSMVVMVMLEMLTPRCSSMKARILCCSGLRSLASVPILYALAVCTGITMLTAEG